eukprot:gene1519-1912_t
MNLDIEGFEEHLRTCKYKFVICKTGGSRCPILREFEKEAHEKECKFFSKICSRCKEIIPIEDRKNHTNNVCPNIRVTCKYCKKTFYKREKPQHKLECYQLVRCQLGCNKRIRIKDLERHIKEDDHTLFLEKSLSILLENPNSCKVDWEIKNWNNDKVSLNLEILILESENLIPEDTDSDSDFDFDSS